MHIQDRSIRLAATDLSKHLACRHLTEVDRARVEGRLSVEPWHDPSVEHRKERGLAHERAYIEFLQRAGRQIVDLRDGEGDVSTRTIAAMRSGAEIIVQGRLADGDWVGYADLLQKVDAPSGLGDFSYEVVDTKLAEETSGGTVLQLALYTDLVVSVQGVEPVRMHVVKPGEPFERETFRFAEFGAYYRQVRRALEESVQQPARGLYEKTYPDPCSHCDICSWWKLCDDRRHEDDHLTLVAGLGNGHARELARQGRATLTSFADAAQALDDRPRSGSLETYQRLQGQARVQAERKRTDKLVASLLPYDHDDETLRGRGLALLPEPDDADVYFDIEGDHFYEGGGLEYLFGTCHREDGELIYRAFRALDPAEERVAFEQLVDYLIRRWDEHPGMHIYHFAPYEPAALKRLMGRHSTRQLEVDRLLRGGRFVDLHAATRQGLRVTVERYSLKDLEPFFGYERGIDLREAAAGRRSIAWSLERNDPSAITSKLWKIVGGYNREDCEATEALQRWLEGHRAQLEAEVGQIPRPDGGDGQAGEGAKEHHERIEEVVNILRAQLPADRDTWTEQDSATALIVELLPYYWREDRCAWWELFRLLDLDPDARLDELKAIEGLQMVEDLGRPTPRARMPVHRFRFPAQEIALGAGNDVLDLEGTKCGEIVAIDGARNTIDIKRNGKTLENDITSVVAFEKVRTDQLEASLLELGRSIAEHGIDGDGPHRAARMLLLKRAPKIATTTGLRQENEGSLQAANRVAASLEGDVLAIQGPPGTGKTFTGSRMIVELVRAGKRVGVTAVSHAVIRNLVEEALDASRSDGGVPIEALIKTPNRADDVPGLETTSDNAAAIAALDDGKLVGGTAWLWSRDDAAEAGVDVLFVDEAGQLSLANALAAGRCASNLILLGDPQQLQQPQQAAHPEGAEIAALEHYLDGAATMPPDKGLFLETTYRMHPAICAFTSGLYYDGRLEPVVGCEGQALIGATPFVRSGLHFVPCEHEANQSRAQEEVERIATITNGLLTKGISWRDRQGAVTALGPEDILVIAPYNAQVGALAERLHSIDPGIPVGTVDRFQGQQAPVVIYSMTSSSAEDAPRGLPFLFDPHRMNVATSRAKCVCILVASPRLVEAPCTSPDQMRWANGMCAYVEMASTEVF